METAEALSQTESPSPCSLVTALCSSQQVTLGKRLCSGVLSVHICESSITNTHLPWTLVSIRGNGGRQVRTWCQGGVEILPFWLIQPTLALFIIAPRYRVADPAQVAAPLDLMVPPRSPCCVRSAFSHSCQLCENKTSASRVGRQGGPAWPGPALSAHWTFNRVRLQEPTGQRVPWTTPRRALYSRRTHTNIAGVEG